MGFSSRAAPTGTTFGARSTLPTNHCSRAPRLSIGHRWLADDEPVPAERAARELKLLEVVVEVERRRVVDVLRILPVRHPGRAHAELRAVFRPGDASREG